MDAWCIVVYIGCCVLSSQAKVQILDQEVRSWSEARTACREKKLTLKSCDLVTEEALTNNFGELGLTAEDEFYYWVGGQRLYEWKWGNSELPLFEDHGCYELDKESRVASSTIKDFNSPYECYKLCRRTGYLYLQGSSCSCKSTLIGSEVSCDKCSSRCPGSVDRCGGDEGVFSVYRVPEQLDFEDLYSGVDCVVGQVRDSQYDGPRLHIETVDCLESRQYFCLSDLQEETLAHRKESYDFARGKCVRTWKSTMPSLSHHNLTDQLVDNYKALITKLNASVSFWLPLRRENRAVWIDGVTGDDNGRFGECLAVRRKVGGHRVDNQPCSSKHRALCDCKTIEEELEEDGGEQNGSEEGESEENKSEDEAASSGLSGAQIAGIVLGILILIVVIGIVGFFLYKKFGHGTVRKLDLH